MNNTDTSTLFPTKERSYGPWPASNRKQLGGYVTKTSEGMFTVPKCQVLFLGTFSVIFNLGDFFLMFFDLRVKIISTMCDDFQYLLKYIIIKLIKN